MLVRAAVTTVHSIVEGKTTPRQTVVLPPSELNL
jgi:hypothetical protein